MMGYMGDNLLNKVWRLHRVASLPSGQDQLFIGLHLIHEVTSPQAFAMLAERNLALMYPERDDCHGRSYCADRRSGASVLAIGSPNR